VHREIVVGALGIDLSLGGFGANRLGDDRAACRLDRGLVVIVQQDGLEGLALDLFVVPTISFRLLYGVLITCPPGTTLVGSNRASDRR